MTQRSYLGWQRYWDEEPWGPWRDNVHMAVLAREVRRARVKPNTRIDLGQFMVRNPEDRRREGEQNFFGMMQAVATPVTPEEANRRSKAARARRSKRR